MVNPPSTECRCFLFWNIKGKWRDLELAALVGPWFNAQCPRDKGNNNRSWRWKSTITQFNRSEVLSLTETSDPPPILLLLIVTCFLAEQCICNLGQFISLLPAGPPCPVIHLFSPTTGRVLLPSGGPISTLLEIIHHQCGCNIFKYGFIFGQYQPCLK